MDIENFIANYPEKNDSKLQQKLLDKTEFSILDETNKKYDDVYYTFQRNLGILLSPVTPYKEMLFYLGTGVGKTCASILVHELTKLYDTQDFRPTIIVTKGKLLEDNYKNEFIRRCPGIEKYFAKNAAGEITDQLGLKHMVADNFSFKRYGSFASFLKGQSDEYITKNYSGINFVLDEGTVLKNRGPAYKQFMRLFRLTNNCTKIIMTGTPVTDHPSEGVGLINLLKPADQQMIVGRKFMTKYYKGGKFNWDLDEDLLEFYHGYVTYLVQTSDLEKSTFEQNPDFPSTFTDFSTYNLEMEPFQQDVYNKALKMIHKTVKKRKDGGLDMLARDSEGNLIHYESKQGGAFMKLAREAELFAWPDGTFGSDGFKKNIIKTKSKLAFKNKETGIELKKNLRSYSVTFDESFQLIKDNPTRVFYIYFDNVNNSGLSLYAKLLEQNLGFSETDGKFTPKGGKRRYVRIDGNIKTPVSQILRKVGMKENADGSVIQVVLGSPTSGIGLTIPNATICCIFDSQFTPANINQITARINRPGSLDWVKEAGLPIDCKNYLFVAQTSEGKSVDLDIYTIAQHKVELNTPQLILMARSDPLCAVSYKRNKTGDLDYKCWTAKKSKNTIFEYTRNPDTKTDVLFWRQEEIAKIKKKILRHVTKGPVYISDFLVNHDPMVVYRTVKDISKSSKLITLPDGDQGIVFVSGDLIFVDKTLSGDPNAAWYLQTKTFPTETTLYDILARDRYTQDKPIVEQLIKTKDMDLFSQLSKYTKILLWESAWGNTCDKKLFSKIKKQFSSYEIDGIPYHILSAEPIIPQTIANANAIVIDDPLKIRVFLDGTWQNYRGDVDSLVTKIKVSQKGKISKIEETIETEHGMYGKYDKKGNFQIVIIGQGTGKRCKFFNKDDHVSMYTKLAGKEPSNFDDLGVDERCAALEKLFKSQGLIKK